MYIHITLYHTISFVIQIPATLTPDTANIARFLLQTEARDRWMLRGCQDVARVAPIRSISYGHARSVLRISRFKKGFRNKSLETHERPRVIKNWEEILGCMPRFAENIMIRLQNEPGTP